MKRLQFELPAERVKELDELLERTGLKTRVNLFNHALTLFEWAVRERESGRIIASMDEETGRYKELEMPGLPHIEDSENDINSLLSDLERRVEAKEYNGLPSAKELAQTKARIAAALVDTIRLSSTSTDELRQWLEQVEDYKTRIQNLSYHFKDLPKSAEEELWHLAEQTETFREWGKWLLDNKEAGAQGFVETQASQRPIPRTEHRASMKVSEEKRGARIYGDPDETSERE